MTTETQGTPLGVAIRNLAEEDPDRPAITDDGGTISRRELERRTNRLARAYAGLGVGEGSFVTIALPNGAAFLEAAIAAWKLGATPQPLGARMPARERDAIVALADPDLVVGVDVEGCRSVPVGFAPAADVSDAPLPPAVAPAWKAPVSGGSTGRPKLIVGTQPAVLEQLLPYAALLRIPSGGVHLVTGPLYHNAPFMFSSVALLTGNHVVVMPRFDAQRSLELVEEHRVDWLYAVPTMMHRISRLPEGTRTKADLSSLRTVLHTAAPCPPWLKEAWIDWLGPERIWEIYAGTEAQAGTLISGSQWLEHRGSVGRPVLGEIEVRGEDGQVLPPGEVGELWMRRGEDAPASYRYIGADPVEADGWESLGDLGWFDEDGYLYLSDRKSDMILVGGANVYPAEIEAALGEHPAVRSSCVIGLPHDDLGDVPHALVQLEHEVTDAESMEHLAERLAGYKLPRSLERVDGPIWNEAGKVRRVALRDERLAATT